MNSEKPSSYLSNPAASQQANLRDMRKKIENLCCNADENCVSNIGTVLQGEDVVSLSLRHESDEELSNSINQTINQSLICNAAMLTETSNASPIRNNINTTINKIDVSLTHFEGDQNALSSTRNDDASYGDDSSSILNDDDVMGTGTSDRDPSTYSRPYVPFSVEEVSLVKSVSMWSNRNICVVGKASLEKNGFNLWHLISIGEEGGPFSIIVDMRLINFPLENSTIQVFGELQMLKDENTPMVLAKFFRDFSSVDLYYYRKTVEELKKFIPHFIERRNSQPRNLDESD